MSDELQLARHQLAEGRADLAIAQLQPLAERMPQTSAVWRLLGIAYHEEQLEPEAVAALTQAMALDGSDIGTATMLAQSSFLAGLAAVPHFERLLALAPNDLNGLRGYAAALAAEGESLAAEQLLRAALNEQPDWLAGHKLLASLRYTAGDKLHFADSYCTACAMQPNNLNLRLEWFRALAQIKDWEAASRILEDGISLFGLQPQLLLARLFIASESGQEAQAAQLFQETAALDDVVRDMALIRFCLRQGELDTAEATALRRVQTPSAAVFWPYLSLIWRLRDDPRAQWLDGAPPLVSAMELAFGDQELAQLADVLRQLHRARSPFAEQSVRGGTQTDQNLFLRHEPILRSLKTKVQGAVSRYVAQLPAPVTGHPLLGVERTDLLRGRMQFSGSWSVRLAAQGFNVSHTHPMGLLSSALYISLPPAAQMGEAPAGWIQFGTPPPELNLPLQPYLQLQPKPGRLVLFPSTSWHSTVPFDDGERLVVAFDVRPPRTPIQSHSTR